MVREKQRDVIMERMSERCKVRSMKPTFAYFEDRERRGVGGHELRNTGGLQKLKNARKRSSLESPERNIVMLIS